MIWTVIAFFIAPFAIFAAGVALDRWHRRYAWRKATQETNAYLRERNPDAAARYGLLCEDLPAELR